MGAVKPIFIKGPGAQMLREWHCKLYGPDDEYSPSNFVTSGDYDCTWLNTPASEYKCSFDACVSS